MIAVAELGAAGVDSQSSPGDQPGTGQSYYQAAGRELGTYILCQEISVWPSPATF